MRKQIVNIAAVALIPFIFTIGEAVAQCGPSLRAQIPFDFIVNGREAKAGSYILEKTNCTTATPTVVLRDHRGRSLGVINRSAIQLRARAGSPAVVFTDYSGKRFLSEVHDRGGRYSFRVLPGKAEIKLAKAAPLSRRIVPIAQP